MTVGAIGHPQSLGMGYLVIEAVIPLDVIAELIAPYTVNRCNAWWYPIQRQLRGFRFSNFGRAAFLVPNYRYPFRLK